MWCLATQFGGLLPVESARYVQMGHTADTVTFSKVNPTVSELRGGDDPVPVGGHRVRA